MWGQGGASRPAGSLLVTGGNPSSVVGVAPVGTHCVRASGAWTRWRRWLEVRERGGTRDNEQLMEVPTHPTRRPRAGSAITMVEPCPHNVRLRAWDQRHQTTRPKMHRMPQLRRPIQGRGAVCLPCDGEVASRRGGRVACRVGQAHGGPQCPHPGESARPDVACPRTRANLGSPCPHQPAPQRGGGGR